MTNPNHQAPEADEDRKDSSSSSLILEPSQSRLRVRTNIQTLCDVHATIVVPRCGHAVTAVAAVTISGSWATRCLRKPADAR